MVVLGIETSCDDTAVALVRDGRYLIGSLVASQVKLHRRFGGIVPEVASRKHFETILPLLDKLFENTGLSKNDIEAIAVTSGPGLLGSLLIGVSTAKTLSYLWNKPLIAVDHLIAHIYSNFIGKQLPPRFPVLALIVSGGHTELVLMKSPTKFVAIGGTRDDAAGEAFDKAAKILGLGYPGGPAIAAEAAKYRRMRSQYQNSNEDIKLPRPMIGMGLDMSFSGLKTALSRMVGKAELGALAFEFQEAVTDVLATKMKRAVRKYCPQALILAGGVAANEVLRAKINEVAQHSNLFCYLPDLKYCTDNAAMVALAAYFFKKQKTSQWYNVEVTTNSILSKN